LTWRVLWKVGEDEGGVTSIGDVEDSRRFCGRYRKFCGRYRKFCGRCVANRCLGPIYGVFAIAGRKFLGVGALGDLLAKVDFKVEVNS
jgi:hypothetical protein